MKNNSEKILKKHRPINLNLKTIWFPITAIASILHRISGMIMFVTIGFLLWFLALSLSSPEKFLQAKSMMDYFIIKFIFWGILTVSVYHALGGIRHMLMDFGCLEETLLIGKITAGIIFLLTIISSILIGIFIW